jgi:hypothetical protein
MRLVLIATLPRLERAVFAPPRDEPLNINDPPRLYKVFVVD